MPTCLARRAALTLGVGVLAAAVGFLVAAGMGALLRDPRLAAQSLSAAAAAGCAAAAITAILLVWPWRHRLVPAALVGLLAASAAVYSIGARNVSAAQPGLQVGCWLGLPRCVPTDLPKMPLLVRSGSVQRHPVVHAILWGVRPAHRAVVSAEVGHAAALDQPLLSVDYGVAPATPGGVWVAPGSATAWLERHHAGAVPASALRQLIGSARRAMHWSAGRAVQWWVVADVTGHQFGLPPGNCADHVHIAGVTGEVVRLPLEHCAQAPTRHGDAACIPLRVPQPAKLDPSGPQAGIELLLAHEFAEAATDPGAGWRVLVRPRCGRDLWVEIADVCQARSAYVRAPSNLTAAGWEPDLLAPLPGGGAACVNPAAPPMISALTDRGS